MIYLRFFGRQINPRPRQSLIMYIYFHLGKHTTCVSSTLRVETFAGRNFRDFADFGQIRESLFRENILN